MAQPTTDTVLKDSRFTESLDCGSPRWPRIALAATLAVGMLPGVCQSHEGNQDQAVQTTNDFAYETVIYVDTEQTPVESHTTIFVGETAYDWETQRALLIDFAARRIVLLNAQKQIQTSLDFPAMEWRLGQTKISLRQAAKSADPRERAMWNFLLEPSYQIQGDSESRVVGFTDRSVKYTVSVQKPTDGDVRQKLARFLDMTTRMSAIQNPWGFARMPVNKWLHEHDMIPTRIVRELTQGLGGKTSTVRSQHEVREQVSNKDRTKIDEIHFWLRDFRSVDFDTYQKSTR
ncbi:MAG: hypothetical protein MPJ50_02705 [Pirellulales bacterium]|nr:hypothetical protein [Pirellulales bacterium]